MPDQAEAFVATLPVAKFHGVGPKTTVKMRALGIETGADYRDKLSISCSATSERQGVGITRSRVGKTIGRSRLTASEFVGIGNDFLRGLDRSRSNRGRRDRDG